MACPRVEAVIRPQRRGEKTRTIPLEAIPLGFNRRRPGAGRGAAPRRRMLIGLAGTVLERATNCIVLETALPAGSVTVDARIDCTARSVIDL
jgi:hypothetical protein